MYRITGMLCLLLSLKSIAQSTSSATSRILYGTVTLDSFVSDPYKTWFNPAFDSYKPDPITVTELKKQNKDNITIEIFFGSWCGDSKREVPRFMKLMKEIGFPSNRISLIGLGS